MRAVGRELGRFLSHVVSRLYWESEAWCERQGRILTGPGPEPGVIFLSSVCHFISHPSLRPSWGPFWLPGTSTEAPAVTGAHWGHTIPGAENS